MAIYKPSIYNGAGIYSTGDSGSSGRPDELKIRINPFIQYGQLSLAFKSLADRGNARIEGDNSVYFTNSGHSQNLGQEVLESGTMYITNGTGGNLFLGAKDNITNISLTTGIVLDLKNVKNCASLIWIYGPNGTLEGDIANLVNIANQMVRLDTRDANSVHGGLGVFSSSETLTNLTLEKTKVSGSILNLSNCIGLATLYLYGSTAITGNPDDLADAMYANGRVSGTMAYTSPTNSKSTYTFSSGGWTK